LKGNEGDWAFSKSIVWGVPECMSLDCKLHGQDHCCWLYMASTLMTGFG
jgi:hypothetical protein